MGEPDYSTSTANYPSQRGTFAAIKQALDTSGLLLFEPGKLEKLLFEIAAMREPDLDHSD